MNTRPSQALRRRPSSACIFCLFRSSPFSTTTPKHAIIKEFVRPRREQPLDSSPRQKYDRDPGRQLPHSGPKLKRISLSQIRPSITQELRLRNLENSLDTDPTWQNLRIDRDTLAKHMKHFVQIVQGNAPAAQLNKPHVQRLQASLADNSDAWSAVKYKYAFWSFVSDVELSTMARQKQQEFTNLQHPAEWFPSTRKFTRHFHLHVGPTNSGKTYNALKRLEQADTGLYAGPLRLLAHEVYMRINAKAPRCDLITGDDRRSADPGQRAPMAACTVEMLPLNHPFDVAVIDEIQMLADPERGWAWTQAILGVMAKEVHLCGEERAVPLLKEIIASCGEKVTVHRYQRLSPLKMLSKSLGGNIRNLRKGDCIVCFQISTIHALRQLVEKTLNKKVAIVYGGLPPETRVQQAGLFNDPDNDYDILIASDAIGMGLNLSIKRLIFQSAYKTQGKGTPLVPLDVPTVKQIAGRAGRYSTALADIKNPKSDLDPPIASPVAPTKQIGFVTTLEAFDYPVVEQAMRSEPDPIVSAGTLPPATMVERFSEKLPEGTPLSYILVRLQELSTTGTRFFHCSLRSIVRIADAIEEIKGLSISDRLTLCAAPIDARKAAEADLARRFASVLAGSQTISILELDGLQLNLIDDEYQPTREYLQQLEHLHKSVIVFLWLSYRYNSIFTHLELAIHVKEIIETRIEAVIARLSFNYAKTQQGREQAILQLLADEGKAREEQRVKDAEVNRTADPVASLEHSPDGNFQNGLDLGEEPPAQSEHHEPQRIDGHAQLLYDGDNTTSALQTDHDLSDAALSHHILSSNDDTTRDSESVSHLLQLGASLLSHGARLSMQTTTQLARPANAPSRFAHARKSDDLDSQATDEVLQLGTVLMQDGRGRMERHGEKRAAAAS